jgi:hypothetical protein
MRLGGRLCFTMGDQEMKTTIEMAREAGIKFKADVFRSDFCDGVDVDDLVRFAELVRADEREQIAQMIEDAPALVEFAQNDKGGCAICGFTPKLAAESIRARGQA